VTPTVAYLRVSTDKQADRGISLEAQRAKVIAYADLFELDLVAIETDAGASAKSLDRPALARALAMLDGRRAAALLVARLDRLTRSVRDLCALVDRHFRDGACALLSVAEQVDTRSAAGRMVLNVLSSVSQWEREAIAERTRAAMRHLVAQGRFTGGRMPPYGFALAADGKTLVPHEAERATIARAREMRAGGMKLRAIAGELARGGVFARSGSPFRPVQILRMLERRT